MRAQDLETPFRGVRLLPCTALSAPADTAPFARDRAQRDDVLRLARAYALVMPECAFLAGRTALALHALPIVHGPELEVAVFSPSRAPRRRGIRGRRIAPELAHVTEVAGIPAATPASAWAMLAEELSVRELVIVGDAIVRIPRDRTGRHRPELALGTIEMLGRAAAAGRRRGAAALRAALEHIRVGSASPLETEFRLDAAFAGLPTPALDHEVVDARGHRLGISEIAYLAERVAVEVEGDHHRTDRRQWNRDLEKYAAYAEAGWEVVRVAAMHLREGSAVTRVRRVLARRADTAIRGSLGAAIDIP